MERFVTAIVAGGIALVAGLWLSVLFPPLSVGWLVGLWLVLAGLGGLGWGIWTEVSMDRLVEPGEP